MTVFHCETIYIVEEPDILEDSDLPLVDTIRYKWPEYDCETMVVDPQGMLYLVSKVDPGTFPKLYLVPQWNTEEAEESDRINLVGGKWKLLVCYERLSYQYYNMAILVLRGNV